MGTHQHSAPLCGEVLQQCAHPPNAFRVQAVDGFVKNQGFWVPQQCGSKTQALPHAQRESPGFFTRHLRESHKVQHFIHPGGGNAVGLRHPLQMVSGATVGVHSFGFKERTDFADRVFQLRIPLPINKSGARCRAVQPDYHAHGGGFTSTVGAQEPGDNTW